MLRAIICLVSLGVAGLAGAQPPPPVRDTSALRPSATAGSAVIRGRVTEAGTNCPLAHALGRVTTSTPGFEKLAATDAGGRFEIGQVARGPDSTRARQADHLSPKPGAKRPL